MKNVRLALALSLASMLAFAPAGSAFANDAHHPGTSATTKQTPAAKKKIKKTSAARKQTGLQAPATLDGMAFHPSA